MRYSTGHAASLFYSHGHCKFFKGKKIKIKQYTILIFFKADPLQDLTVLPTEKFHRCKTHIQSVINLPTEMLRR